MSDTPNEDRLTLTLDWPEITVSKLSKVARLWAEIIQESSRSAAGKRTGVKWLVESISFRSPLQLTAEPHRLSARIDPAAIRALSHSVVDGFRSLSAGDEPPDVFTDAALEKIKQLAREAIGNDRQMFVSNGTEQKVFVGPRVIEAVDQAFGPTIETLGTIEGRLEGVFTHGTRRFYVYDSLTNKQVRCDFGSRIPLTPILAAFEQRVGVTGFIKTRAKTGQKLSVQVHEFRTFRPDSELPSTDEILKAWRQNQ